MLSALFVLNQFTKGLWVSIHFFLLQPSDVLFGKRGASLDWQCDQQEKNYRQS
jgi:hypothetical protein